MNIPKNIPKVIQRETPPIKIMHALNFLEGGTETTSVKSNISPIWEKIEAGVLRIQEERDREYFRFIPECNHEVIKKFNSLPGYYDPCFYPFFVKPKPAELEYLYELASKKDKFGEYRIPACTFPFYYDFPIQQLKLFEPILLSKNDMGTWNYRPTFILDLVKYNLKQVDMMSKLLQCNVHRNCVIDIVSNPHLPHKAILEKSQALKTIYGEKLREISFFINNKNETYITADIQLPSRADKPDYYNFKQVFVKVDDELNPMEKPKVDIKTKELVNSMYKKIETNLSLFRGEDLLDVLKNVCEKVPEANPEDALTAMQKLTQFANYSSLNNIGEKLKDNGIGRVFDGGELGSVFNYLLMSKKLVSLDKKYKSNFGLFVTKKDINNPEFVSHLKRLKNSPDFLSEVRLINLEGWSDGVNLLSDDRNLEDLTIKSLKKSYKIMKKKPKLTFQEALDKVLNNSIDKQLDELGLGSIRISVDNEPSFPKVLEQMRPIMPTKSIMQSNIELIAKRYTKGNKSFKKLCNQIVEYYDSKENVFSKQNIIESLESINKKINEFVVNNDIPDENVYFIKPFVDYSKKKSFDIITKMYQDMYNIDSKKIVQISTVHDLNQFPSKSAFVILDDFSATGHSMGNVACYDLQGEFLDGDKHIIFAPIASTKTAKSYVQDLINSFGRKEKDTIVFEKEIATNNEKFESVLPTEILSSGYGKSDYCTVFPYMAADNNSKLAGDLTVFFLPNHTCVKNKSINLSTMKEDTYYYDVFGTDKDYIMTDAHRAYCPTSKDISYDKLKMYIKKIFLNY